MITEAEEHKLYEQIKSQMKAKSGSALIMYLDDHGAYHCDSIEDLVRQNRTLISNDRTFAVYDFFEDHPIFYFYGKTFRKEENLATGQVILYALQKEILDLEKVKEEFKKLGNIIRQNQAS